MLLLPIVVGMVLTVQLIQLSAHAAGSDEGIVIEGPANAVAALAALASLFVGGAMWARGLATLFALPKRRAMLAGALGYGVPFLAAGIALAQIEINLTAYVIAGWQMHILYGLLFVPTVFVIATLAGGAVALTSGRGWSIWQPAVGAGAGAALGFLAVFVLLDLAGMRVGAPGAEERTIMILVTLAGMVAAALAGSWAWGRLMPTSISQAPLVPEAA
jgi:hypothetical protein